MSQSRVWLEVSHFIENGNYEQFLPTQSPERIIVFGIGSSYFAAQLIAHTLRVEWSRLKQHTDTRVLACSAMAIGSEINPGPQDWVVGLSHRGKTPATVQAFELSRNKGAWGIWGVGRGGAQNSLASLNIYTSELEKCEPHTIGMTGAICAITSLLLGKTGIQIWNELSQIALPQLETLRSKFQTIPTLIIGEWEGEWIAKEIRLKLIEMARLRPLVFGSEEFFHGPQLFSESGIKAREGSKLKWCDYVWYIETPGDARSARFSEQSNLGSACITQVSRTHGLAWVPALVELQWRALAVALNQGRNPDG